MPLPLLLLLPQLVSRPSPDTLSAMRRKICRRRRFLKPKQQSTAASAEAGMSGLELRRKEEVLEEVAATASMVAAIPVAEVLGVTVVGEKVHVALAGSPVQAKETVPVKPNSAETKICW